MKRRTVIFLALAVMASCKGRGKTDEQYKTEKAGRGNVTMTVTATGTISAVTTVQIGSQVSGVISHLYVDFNSKVRKGQLLAELDPTPFQAQVEQRRADLTKATVDAANAKVSLGRLERLLQAGLAPNADVDNARAQFRGAEAQAQQASAALRQAETNLHYTSITSPIDGIVVDREYDVGQTVAASFQAPTLFSIAQDLTKMQVQADVDQSDIGRVKVGQPAQFTVDAYPEEQFRGRISQIRLNATVSQNVVSYPVIIEVPNPDERLRPKMTANVTVDVAMVSNVLRIPNGALRFKPATSAEDKSDKSSDRTATATVAAATQTVAGNNAGGGANTERGAMQMGQHKGRHGLGGGGLAGVFGGDTPKPKKPQTVYLLDATNKLKPVEIRTGISDGRYTEVVSGDLKEGDVVVVGLATTKVEGPAAFGGAAGGPGGGARPGGGGGGRGRG